MSMSTRPTYDSFLYVPLELNKAMHYSTKRCSSNWGRSTSWLTSTRLLTALRAVRPISTAVAASSSPGLILRAWFLGKHQHLLRGTDGWREVFLLNTRSRKTLVNVPCPAARAELKSATSLPDAGMVDCRVRRVGEAGSDVRESNSCMHVTRSCTHCSSDRIRLGPHSMCFIFASFRLTRTLYVPWQKKT